MDYNSAAKQNLANQNLPNKDWTAIQYKNWIRQVTTCTDEEADQICQAIRLGDWFDSQWHNFILLAGIKSVLPEVTPICVHRLREKFVQAFLAKRAVTTDQSEITISRVLEAVDDGKISGEVLKEQLKKKLLQQRRANVTHPYIPDQLTFPLPRGIDLPTAWMNMEHPPFLNRQRAVSKLLHNCFLNYVRQIERSGNEEAKPLAAFLGTTAGYGKTRLLLEWAIRAFHDKNVLYSFLVDSTPLAAADTNPNQIELVQKECPYSFEELYNKFTKSPYDPAFDKDRVAFLHVLKNTLKRSLIISSSEPKNMIQITNNNDNAIIRQAVDVLCRKIVESAISIRFAGRKVTIDGKPITITPLEVDRDEDRKFLEVNQLLLPGSNNRELISLLSLFVKLVLQEHPKQEDEKSLLLLINIDESQVLLVPAGSRTLAFEVIKLFYEAAPKLQIADKLDICFFVFMTGLATCEANLLEDATALRVDLTLPLTPLLKYEYCNTVIQNIHLMEGSRLTKVEPSKAGKKVIRSLWRRCLGIPRAVQILHRLLNTKLLHIIKNKNISAEDEKNILREFNIKTQKYFQNRSAASYQVPEDVWENLTIECCLGLERVVTDKIVDNVEVTYSQLEEQGAILPIKFSESEFNAKISRCYTMPFLYFSEMLGKSLKSLTPPESLTELIKTFTPVIGDIVGSTRTDGLQAQGDYVERACATSLWACYRMQAQAGEFVKLQDIVPSWPKDNHYVCFSGVGCATQQIKVNDLMRNSQISETLKQEQCIVINVQNSHFADVMVPVVQGTEAMQKIMNIKEQMQQLDEMNKTNDQQELATQLKDALLESTVFLLVQCRNMKANNSKIGPSSIAKELNSQGVSGLMQREGHFYVLMSPNLPPGTWLAQAKSPEVQNQLKMYQENLIETNGKGWLGELFLILNTDMKKVDEVIKKEKDSVREENCINEESNDDEVETTHAHTMRRMHEKEMDDALEEKSVKKKHSNKIQTEGPKRQSQKRKHEQVEYGEDKEKKRTKKKLKIH